MRRFMPSLFRKKKHSEKPREIGDAYEEPIAEAYKEPREIGEAYEEFFGEAYEEPIAEAHIGEASEEPIAEAYEKPIAEAYEEPRDIGKAYEEPNKRRFGLARIFYHEELREATNYYNSSMVLGEGGYGIVYRGTLPGGQTVVVKKLYSDGTGMLNEFLNEVTVLSQIRHKNLVTLYGCTDPICQELFMVYEFMPNGTVADHIHDPTKPALTWAVRIQIAIQLAEGLAYLHAREPSIIHRNVNTYNTLLDNAFNVKVAGLIVCRVAPWSTTHVSTIPQGTMGYRDPEYEHTFKLSDKSDVYSFGVVLVELISGQRAVDVNRELDEIYLDSMFLSKIPKDKFDAFVDPKLEYHVDPNVRTMIHLVEELARQCLRPKGDARPPMAEVLNVLKGIKDGCNVVEEVGV